MSATARIDVVAPGAAAGVLQLLPERQMLPPVVREPKSAGDAPTPSPPPAIREAPSAFVATDPREHSADSASLARAVPVLEELALDTAALASACAAAYPESAADLRHTGALTVLVKVEANGRPSEVKVVASSGSDGLDEGVAACLMSLGNFSQTIEEGRAIAAWRRLEWPHVTEQLSAERASDGR